VDFGATGIAIGVIFSGFAVARTVFLPVMGRLSDRFGRNFFIIVGLLFYAVISFAYPLAFDVSSLTFIRFLHGFGSAMVMPAAMAFIGETSPRGKEGLYMGTFSISIFLGFGIGPLIGGLLALFSKEVSFFALGILSSAAFILTLLFLPENKVDFKGKALVPFKVIVENNIIKGILCIRVIHACGIGTILAFLPVIATSLNLMSFHIGILVSVNMVLNGVLQSPFGRLADSFNKVLLIVVGCALSAGAIFLMPMAGGFSTLLLLDILMGVGGAFSVSATTVFATTLGRSYGMGTTMGLLNTAMGVGMILGSLISGMVLDSLGIRYVFYFGGVIGCMGTVAFFLLVRNKDHRTSYSPVLK